MKHVWVLVWLLLESCRFAEPDGPYQPADEGVRHTAEAEQLTNQAAEHVGSDLDAAEALLREALSADIFFGPAHNNLGVIHLKRGNLYEAANEFEWARKLMPGHPDPRLNLAITLDRAGRSEEAFAAYSAALEVYPEYLPAIQGLASLALRSGRQDDRIRSWLASIALRAEDSHWREWAAQRLASGR